MVRNHSCSISGRGSACEDRKRKTKKTGNSPCTASPEPARRPTNAPSAAQLERDQEREHDQHEHAAHARLDVRGPAAKPTAR